MLFCQLARQRSALSRSASLHWETSEICQQPTIDPALGNSGGIGSITTKDRRLNLIMICRYPGQSGKHHAVFLLLAGLPLIPSSVLMHPWFPDRVMTPLAHRSLSGKPPDGIRRPPRFRKQWSSEKLSNHVELAKLRTSQRRMGYRNLQPSAIECLGSSERARLPVVGI